MTPIPDRITRKRFNRRTAPKGFAAIGDAIFALHLRCALAVCATFTTAPGLAHQSGSKTFDHIFVIVLENHGFDDALYNGPSSFLRRLSQTQGLAANYFGVTHPSLPNYLALISGDEFGVRDDNPSCFASDLRPGQACHGFQGETLVDQLEEAGLSFALYAELLPIGDVLQRNNPPVGDSALYAQKHNPFVYFEQIATNLARRQKFKPFEALASDLGGAAPSFVFIVPNQCHDGHGLPTCNDADQLTRDYDTFVKQTIGLIQASPNWTRNSAIVITFDEGEAASGIKGAPAYVDCCGADANGATLGGNHVATIVVTQCGGPATNATPMNHYALLATIEDGFHLPRLRKAIGAPTLMDLFDPACH